MNYMPEVAKILGVEIGEEFYIKEQPDIKCTIYNDGLYVYPINDCICTLPSCDVTLSRLLRHTITIKRKPWKPQDKEKYFVVTKHGNVNEVIWNEHTTDYIYYKLGNCYKTYNEAVANSNKWKSFFALAEVLEV